MTDAFASVVSPVFQYVIDLQQRMEVGEAPALEPERERIMALLAEADQRANVSSQLAHDFELARHALVYWIDEVLINSSWKHATEWRQRILEWDYYGQRLRADLFYEKAREAEALAGTDPLEVFYLCVALGFRGQHVNSPGDLRKWADRVYNRIASGSTHPDKPFPDEATGGDEIAPLPGPSLLLGASILVSLTALFTLACFVLAVPPWE
jgi:type VI secretion system protein ImpK